jgi:hypothetical protein
MRHRNLPSKTLIEGNGGTSKSKDVKLYGKAPEGLTVAI